MLGGRRRRLPWWSPTGRAWPHWTAATRSSWLPTRWPGPCTTPRAPPGARRGCGRACGLPTRPRRPSPTRPISGRSDPTTSTWCAPRCTTRCPSGSPGGRCCAAAPASCSGRFDAEVARTVLDRRTRARADHHLHGAGRPGPPPGHGGGVGGPVRLVAPAGPRRFTVSPLPQAVGPGTGGPRGAVGVLRLHRGPVHRVLARGVDGPARDGGPGPARAAPCRWTTMGPSGAARPTSPGSATGGTTTRPRRPGGTEPSPSETSVGSTSTGTSSSTGAGTT